MDKLSDEHPYGPSEAAWMLEVEDLAISGNLEALRACLLMLSRISHSGHLSALHTVSIEEAIAKCEESSKILAEAVRLVRNTAREMRSVEEIKNLYGRR
jgi:hypothetical protein